MKEKIKKKLMSPVAWSVFILQLVGIIALYNVQMSEQVSFILKAVLEVAIAFGILNNPDDRGNF